MIARRLALFLLMAGVVLIAVAFVWPYVLPSSLLYDDTQAIELNEASASLHETMHAHGHEHDHDHFGDVQKDATSEVAMAAKRYREAQSKLDSAKFWTSSLPAYLRWSAVAAWAVGVAILKLYH